MTKYLTVPESMTGMPKGIKYIIGNEAAERFSYYGMRGILTIFMVAHLRNSSGGPDFMSDEEAKEVFHLFSAAAYFFPILGSLISDVLWGKYRTILILSLGYCVGHACIAFGDLGFGTALMEPRTWLYLGLAFIAVGAGGIKPCVSAHVGDQFGKDNQHLLTKIFSWFYFSINVGAAASNLLTPVLLDKFGPGAAFGLPGVLMALATFVFWLGRNKFVHIPPAGIEKFKEETFSPEGMRAIKNLTPLFLLFVPMFWSIFDQSGSAWVLQAMRMDRYFLGIHWYEAQVQFVNPVLILILIPTFAYIVYPMVGRLVTVTPLRKIGVGLFVTALAFGLSAWIEEQIQGGAVVHSSSSGDRQQRQAINLLDGDLENSGWVSALDPNFGKPPAESESEAHFPQEIVLQLREYRPWQISSLKLYPLGDMPEFLQELADSFDDQPNLSEVDPTTCLAKSVRVSVSDSPEPADGWTEVATVELPQQSQPQTVEFDPVDAAFVKLEILENWGGPCVGLGEVEVLAAGEPKSGASGDLQNVWPNVAAVGFRPNIAWQFLAYLLLTAAEVMVSIVCLEFAYTQAPPKMKSFIMGIYFLGVSLGNLFTAAVNKFIQNADGTSKLQGASYYWFFTAGMFIIAVLYVVWSQFYKGKTYIQGEDAPEADPNVIE